MKFVTRAVSIFAALLASIYLGCNNDSVVTPVEGGTNAACRDRPGNRPSTAPVALLCVITVPGLPITSGTKSWIDAGKYYLTDVNNSGVDVIDAANHVFLQRIIGFAGPATAGGGTTTTNGSGPNSLAFTTRNELWVPDGNSSVQVLNKATYAVAATVSTAYAACDGGTATTHYCGRTNEIDYDPEDQIISLQNPSPLDVNAPHAALPPYVTFISAAPPYTVLGRIVLTGASGVEAGVYDVVQHRFIMPVAYKYQPGAVDKDTFMVINPTTRVVEKKYGYDCATVIGTTSTTIINDLFMGPNGRAISPLCGKAVVVDLRTGAVVKAIQQVGGGNQTWYNSGDGMFYVTGLDPATNLNSLGVIDANTSTWLQNVPALQITNPTAFADNNHIFAVVQVNAAQVADPTTDTSVCTMFGVRGKGCIAVFSHLPPNTSPRYASPAPNPGGPPLGVVPDDDYP